jgi:hypothetical protein
VNGTEPADEIDLVNEEAGDCGRDHQRHPKLPERLVHCGAFATHEDDNTDDRSRQDGRNMNLNGKRRLKKRFEVHRRVPVEFPIAFNKTALVSIETASNAGKLRNRQPVAIRAS